MPLPNLPIPPYPDVPDYPGVPPLLRSVFSPPSTVLGVPVRQDTTSALGVLPTQRWGIYTLAGAPVLVGDSVLGIEYMQDYRVSNYPQEQGAFASYNKVQVPFEPRVSFAKGGTQAERAQFIADCEAALATLDLFAVVTPEKVYSPVTLTHTDYQRSSRGGVGLLTINIWGEQVRETGTQVFRSTETPTSADVANTGPVQPYDFFSPDTSTESILAGLRALEAR